VPYALTIAGSDSGGGAGIQQDLLVFSAFGVRGLSVLTAITAQTPDAVHAVTPLPPATVHEQLSAVLNHFPVRWAKTGMLFSPETAAIVADTLQEYRVSIVVDPVLRAGVGASLSHEKLADAIKEQLLPVADLITPNAYEAERLTGVAVRDSHSMLQAASRLHEQGAKAVLIKGGHLEGTPTDLLLVDGEIYWFRHRRIRYDIHGLGCTLSAAITALLSLGLDIPQAVGRAERYLRRVIRTPLKTPGKRYVTDPLLPLRAAADRARAIHDVRIAVQRIVNNRHHLLPFTPEVGLQICRITYPYATLLDSVAIEGRIRRGMKRLIVGEIAIGASSHLTRLLLRARRYNTRIRAALNLRYDTRLLAALQQIGLRIEEVDRSKEPADVAKVEGASMRWVVDEAVSRKGQLPDVICSFGAVGKEPMTVILATTALKAAELAIRACSRALESG